MTISSVVAVALLGLAVALVLVIVLRPRIGDGQGGRIFTAVGLIFLPALATYTVGETHLERSRRTDFCLSCHVMHDYGRSLHVDDASFLAASHYQNNRVPREQACYTCHTDYTMFGGVDAKLRGLRHLAVQYFGAIPDTVRLYSPYRNRECLHCHAGARNFEENEVHNLEEKQKADLAAERLSCLSSGCHDVVHAISNLDSVATWQETQ